MRRFIDQIRKYMITSSRHEKAQAKITVPTVQADPGIRSSHGQPGGFENSISGPIKCSRRLNAFQTVYGMPMNNALKAKRLFIQD